MKIGHNRFSWNIHMDESRIWMNGDKLAPKRFRIQSKTEACFFEIVTLSIEDTTKNSSGQSMASWFYGSRWSRKRYLVLILVSGRKKRFHVSHFTDSALAQIIDEIADRCEDCHGPYDGRHASQILFGL